MNPTPPPPGSSGDDEVLSFLARLERFLLDIIKGVLAFFVHRIPKWTYDFIKGCLEHLWEYLERFVRIVLRLGRVVALTGVLIAMVVGPGVALYNSAYPWALPVWIGLIVVALLFALQRRIVKEYERRKREKAARLGPRFRCRYCHTVHTGPLPPPFCTHCEEKWDGVEV